MSSRETSNAEPGFASNRRTLPPLQPETAAWGGQPPHLRLLSPTDGARDVVLDRQHVSIGRSSRCDLVLGYGAVSRVHAELSCHEGSWVALDRGSRGGTLLNGKPLPPNQATQIVHGDTLQISRVAIQFRRDQRLVRSDGYGMTFSALPSSIRVRMRRIHLDPSAVFGAGDTVLVGQAGGLQMRVPVDWDIPAESIIEVELRYPGAVRDVSSLAEVLGVAPGREHLILMCKLHSLQPDRYQQLIGKARRDGWRLVPEPSSD